MRAGWTEANTADTRQRLCMLNNRKPQYFEQRTKMNDKYLFIIIIFLCCSRTPYAHETYNYICVCVACIVLTVCCSAAPVIPIEAIYDFRNGLTRDPLGAKRRETSYYSFNFTVRGSRRL